MADYKDTYENWAENRRRLGSLLELIAKRLSADTINSAKLEAKFHELEALEALRIERLEEENE